MARKAKLSIEDVALIEALLLEREELQRQLSALSSAALAKKFEVSPALITQIGAQMREAA